jgi:hypothetical protein
MAAKFKMASETYVSIILLSNLQFSISLNAFEASFYYLFFLEKTFFQIFKMVDFTKMTSFLRKKRLST